MKSELPRRGAYLRAVTHGVAHGQRILAAAVRDASTTVTPGTVVRPQRWWIALRAALVTAIALAATACGGPTRTDTYARGTDLQEECCESLDGAPRDACLAAIVRIHDPGAAATATNQQTYACVVDHFVCDPATGHETAASAQAQHDCTDELLQ